MSAGERAAAAARGCVGARFRLHGRDMRHGLDCVGVAALSLRAAGHAGAVPTGYALRSGDWRPFARFAEGLARASEAAPGDIVLCRVAPGQVHLVVRTAGGFVHADAGLRRVVERPGEPPWPVMRAWRVREQAEE